MKKVLMLSHVASMIDQFCMPNIGLLLDMGCEVHVASNFERGYSCSGDRIESLKARLDEMGISWHQIDFERNPLKPFGLIKAYRELKGLMQQEHYDMVHSNGPVSGILGRISASKLGIKSLYTAHGFHFFKGCSLIRWVLFYTAEKYCAKKTDILVTMNREDYETASRRFRAGKVVYTPGVGMDLSRFTPLPDDEKLNIRKKNHIPEDKKWVLCVGELIKRKNHAPLILAAAAMPDVFLTIAGVGPLEGRLKELIEGLGAADRIKLLGFREDVADLTGACDFFAFPSLQEGLPVAVMEAMASGCPIALSRIRGNVDLVKEGEGGFFFEPSSAASIGRALSNLLAHGGAAMGEANVRNVKNFGIDKVLPLYRQWYGELLGE